MNTLKTTEDKIKPIVEPLSTTHPSLTKVEMNVLIKEWEADGVPCEKRWDVIEINDVQKHTRDVAKIREAFEKVISNFTSLTPACIRIDIENFKDKVLKELDIE